MFALKMKLVTILVLIVVAGGIGWTVYQAVTIRADSDASASASATATAVAPAPVLLAPPRRDPEAEAATRRFLDTGKHTPTTPTRSLFE